jgi:hypothetical protein
MLERNVQVFGIDLWKFEMMGIGGHKNSKDSGIRASFANYCLLIIICILIYS